MIPAPRYRQEAQGYFTVEGCVRLCISSPALEDVAGLLSTALQARGVSVERVTSPADKSSCIHLRLASAATIHQACNEQGYKLSITSEVAVLEGASPAGAFAGMQTLLQLVSASESSPHIHIKQQQVSMAV